ncbi:MAG: cytochrome P450 [Chloroflexota bacterium]
MLTQHAIPDDKNYSCHHSFNMANGDKSHLAFGQGIHYCVGAPLARLETQIALSTLASRLPQIQLGVSADELKWFYNFPIRSLQSVPLNWTN